MKTAEEIRNLELELAEKFLTLANLQADTALKDTQRFLAPKQYMLSALTVGFTSGAGLIAGIWALVKYFAN